MNQAIFLFYVKYVIILNLPEARVRKYKKDNSILSQALFFWVDLIVLQVDSLALCFLKRVAKYFSFFLSQHHFETLCSIVHINVAFLGMANKVVFSSLLDSLSVWLSIFVVGPFLVCMLSLLFGGVVGAAHRATSPISISLWCALGNDWLEHQCYVLN